MAIRPNSKNIAEIDYKDGLLRAEFTNGRVYYYTDVPAEVYEALEAEAASTDPDASVGKAFNKLVKGGGFNYHEVENV